MIDLLFYSKKIFRVIHRTFYLIGMVAASSYTYPESEDNGWDGTCVDGGMQSPIDLKSNMTATVHAPITFKNYFNGPFNKV